jgi:hypothetical protein
VTSGKVSPLLKMIGVISKVGPGSLDAEAGDLDVTAGWGSRGKEGVTMPGKGKRTERRWSEEELAAIKADAQARQMDAADYQKLLGESTCDVYLNATAYWQNIPLNVWEYHIGGYQVMKKWLSYREKSILGRGLKPEEAREVTGIARRIAAIILLQPHLDANYQSIKAATYEWPNG